MSSVGFNDVKGFGTKRRKLSITFFPDGSNAPVVNSWQIRGVASVARSSAGVYLITLSDTYQQIFSKQCSYQKTTAAALFAQFGDVSNIATSTPVTVVVRLVNGSGTETEAAAFNANQSVSVDLEFNDSTA